MADQDIERDPADDVGLTDAIDARLYRGPELSEATRERFTAIGRFVVSMQYLEAECYEWASLLGVDVRSLSARKAATRAQAKATAEGDEDLASWFDEVLDALAQRDPLIHRMTYDQFTGEEWLPKRADPRMPPFPDRGEHAPDTPSIWRLGDRAGDIYQRGHKTRLIRIGTLPPEG